MDLERLLQATLDAIPDIIGIQDLHHRILRYNAAGYRFFGLTPEQVEGRRCFELMGWNRQCAECATSLAIKSGQPSQIEKYVEELDVWLDIRAYPIRDDETGEVVRVIEHLRDISDAKRAEQALRESEAQMQQAQKLESLGVLAGGIAHDFNNLLVGILGNASLALADLPESSPVFELLGDIETSAMRAAELVQQLLAYAGKGRVFTEPLDLGGVVQEMAQLLRASISKKAILRLELAEDLPQVEADPNQIRQVVMNLVTNASDALEEDGAITVSTGCMECDDTLAKTGLELPAGTCCFVRVADTGAGLDASVRSRIFEPFFTTKFAGRGLGLAAVAGIVRNHRGTIQVESEPGRGARFTVLLPAAAPSTRRAGAVTAPKAWRGEGAVLLVDDEETVRLVGRRMLERLGFEVVTASDGRQALEIFDAEPDRFVLVLLDLSMPVMNGTECLDELRRRREVPVVLSSGYTEEEATSRFSEQGLAGFIQKPYRLQSLRETLRGILAR